MTHDPLDRLWLADEPPARDPLFRIEALSRIAAAQARQRIAVRAIVGFGGGVALCGASMLVGMAGAAPWMAASMLAALVAGALAYGRLLTA